MRHFIDLQLLNAYVNVFNFLPKVMLHPCDLYNLVDMYNSANGYRMAT